MADKGFLDEIDDKPESFSDEVFISSKKRKLNIKPILVGLVATVIVVLAVLFINRGVDVPNFVNEKYESVIEWADDNQIKIKASKTYSNEVKKGFVISQVETTKLKKNQVLNIVVSDGADPDEEIDKPNFLEMTKSDIQAFIDTNALTGVKFKTEFSETVQAGAVISVRFDEDSSVFKRKTKVEISVSKGKESDSKTVVIPDFSSYSERMIKEWASERNVTINFEYNNSVTAKPGTLISQSVQANKEVARSTDIKVVMSKGAIVTIPHFAYYTKEEAMNWANEHGIKLKIKDKYSENIIKGYAISQSLKKNSEVNEGDQLTLVYSLGKINLNSFVGQSYLEFHNWLEDINLHGGNLRVKKEYFYSPSIEKDYIISHSDKNKEINNQHEITVTISQGKGVIMPSLVGLKQNEAIAKCQENQLKCVFTFDASDQEKDTVLSQLQEAGSLVSNDDLIKLSVSKGR